MLRPGLDRVEPSDLVEADNAVLHVIAKLAQQCDDPSKHDYINDHRRGPVLTYEDAVLGYFLARRFGTVTIVARGQLDELVVAVEETNCEQRYFHGVRLFVSRNEPAPDDNLGQAHREVHTE